MTQKTPESIALSIIEYAIKNDVIELDLTNISSLTSISLTGKKHTIEAHGDFFLFDEDYTKLQSLPSEIGNIPNLTHLNLSYNELFGLPSEIRLLSKLIFLDISFNRLISLPKEIGQLTNLTSLDLSNNQIVTLPDSIWRLQNLEKLYLSKNKLTVLPQTILLLKNLKYLDLRDNDLDIPLEILEKVYEPKKILGYLFGDHVISQISEILHQVEDRATSIKFKESDELSTKELSHLISLFIKDNYKRPLNEVKILVIGQGSVGKTSLVQQILHGTFDERQTKTEGISIIQWSLENEVLPGVKLNFWDFGGQEIMHATHQFFLTKRSLYLLVLDSRLAQDENRVEYWVKIIESFGGASPVLVVGNKTDQHPLDIDRTGLQKKYHNIVGILETSAATGAGIEELKAAITKQVNDLPHVRDLLPETWFTVKTKLEELGREKNYISQDNYLELCAVNEINDEISQRTLIGFLHDLGVVLHFQDDPRLESLGILNPQWVTNGVYKILNSHALFQNKGVLTLPMLNEILNIEGYPRDKRLFIVDMMKKFELCYDIEPDKSFLVPDLLPKDEPQFTFNGIPAFEYLYPVLPSSVMTRFIVRMNHNIQNGIVWRTGVLLQIGENKALVKADIEDRTIRITIDGREETRRDALAAIRYQLDEIHASIKGLNPEKRVPIPDAPNAEPLDYDYLLQLERDGELENLPVKDGNRLIKVNVRKLLSGVVSEAERKSAAGNTTTIYIGGDMKGSLIAGNENQVGYNSDENARPNP